MMFLKFMVRYHPSEVNQVRKINVLENEEPRVLRLKQIIGCFKSIPPIKPVIPVSKSTWWAGVKTGRFPRPIKLGPRTTVWRADDILKLIEREEIG